MLVGKLHAPCAVCGVSSSDGLFPPAPSNADAYRPAAARVPLCTSHKLEFLRGDMPFPQWCPRCDAYRSEGHSHPAPRPAQAAVGD